jgi:phosphatidylglycerophosphate synthase
MRGNIQKRERMSYGWAFQHARRGGGLYSDRVTLQLSSFLTTMLPTSVHPSLLSLANLVVGVGTSILAILAVNVEPTWLVGLLVTFGWQLAYVIDSADGLIARATGRTSSSGAIVDPLCDIAVKSGLSAAVCVAVSHEYHLPLALLALFSASWMVSPMVSALLRGMDEDSHRLLPTRSPIVAVLKLPRDYGFLVLLLGAAYALWRPLLLVLLMGILAMNLFYWAGMLAIETRQSILATRPPLDVDSRPLEPMPAGSTQ